MIVDSHCHLDSFEDLDTVIKRAKEQDVHKMVTIGTEFDDFERLSAICKKYSQNVEMTVGIHPDNVIGLDKTQINQAFQNVTQPYVIGIGEIGLDYHENPSQEVQIVQKNAFEYQLNLALGYEVPVYVHTRAAIEDTLSIVKNSQVKDVVFHCFCEDIVEARKVLDLGYTISLSGIVTFKNARQVAEVAQFVPLDRLLIETDAPYLAPTPYRGKRNEPAYVRWVGEFLAHLKGIPSEQVFSVTTENFYRIFKKSKKYEVNL